MGTRTAEIAALPVQARLGVAVVFLVFGSLTGSWVARLPAIQQKLQLAPGPLGLALLCSAVGAMIGMPLTTWLVARWGSRAVTRASIFAFCAVVMGPALAIDQLSLAGALLLLGVASGVGDVAMNLQAVAVEQAYRRPIMASFHALFSIGGMLGSFAGGLAAGQGVSPAVHLTLAGAGLAAVALWAGPKLLPVPAPAATEKHWVQPTRETAALSVIAFTIMCCEGAMADWSALYLRSVIQTGAGVAAMGYAAFSLAMAAGRLTGDRMTQRFGPVKMVRQGACIAGLGMALSLAIPNAAPTLVGFLVIGLGFATIIPLVFSAAGRLPGGEAGGGLAAITAAGYLGLLTGPPLIGFLAQASNLRAALASVIVFCAAAAVLAGAVRRATH